MSIPVPVAVGQLYPSVPTCKHLALWLSCIDSINSLGCSPHMYTGRKAVNCLPCVCSVVIRGQPSDDAMVCTESRTYELKLVETSNTLLLAPSLMTPKDPGMHCGVQCAVY